LGVLSAEQKPQAASITVTAKDRLVETVLDGNLDKDGKEVLNKRNNIPSPKLNSR
jgi:hypothetical protein